MTNEERALELISELGTLMNPNPTMDNNVARMILNELNQIKKSIEEMKKSDDLVYDTKEVMEKLNLPSTDRVDQLRRAGLLPAIKLGRGYQFRKERVEEFLESIENKDLSNKEKINIYASVVKRNKKAAQGGTRAAG